MGRAKPQPRPAATPPADISPFEVGEDDEVAGGGVPDEDGWIHLEKKEAPREDKAKPRRRPAQRRAKGSE